MGAEAWLEVRVFGETLGPRRRLVSAPFALKAEGEVPQGAVVLGQTSADANIIDLGYTQIGDTIGLLYLYRKNAYSPAAPRVPQRVSYQGRVVPTETGSLPTVADLAFGLFDSATGGTPLWSETRPATPLDNGLFSLELGAITPLLPTHLAGKDRWLELSVAGETLAPREKISAAPYALVVESPVPPGAVVLSASTVNEGLSAKKFSALPGATVGGYHPFVKSVFNPAAPSVPLLVSHQGKLANPLGAPLPGPVDLGFRLFDGATSGSLLWSETLSAVPLADGLYSVLLGAASPLTPSTFPGATAYLAVSVRSGLTTETLSPRSRLTSVPFALSAESTLPPSALVLGETSNDPNLLAAGFQATGDAISGYFVFSKTDVDLVPPWINIIEPVPGYATGTAIDIDVIFGDSLSGVDLDSLVVYHNNTDITSSLSITPNSATGAVTAVEGGNLISVWLADQDGNLGREQALVMTEWGNAPSIAIEEPADGATLLSQTPTFVVSYSDTGSGPDLATLTIMLDAVDRTSRFTVSQTKATWLVLGGDTLANGPHTLTAQIADKLGNLSALVSITFSIAQTATKPTVTAIAPDFTIAGDTVTITGTNFSSTVAENLVYFSGTLGQVRAEVTLATGTTLRATVPGGALTGDVWVERGVVGGSLRSVGVAFKLGLPYAYIANRISNRVVVFDYRSNQISSSILVDGANPTPYGTAISPDGHWLFVTKYALHQLAVINTLTNTTVNNVPLRCGADTPTNPISVAVSPDGSRAFVASNNKYITIIEIKKVVPDTLSGTTLLCQAVTNYHFTDGSSFTDIAFTPDGEKALIATDNAGLSNGIVIELVTDRYYETSFNSNPDYLDNQSHTLSLANSSRNPRGIEALPQSFAATPTNPWRLIVANMGSNSYLQMNSQMVQMPTYDFQMVSTSFTPRPAVFGAVDAASSPLGDRTFFGFYYSNNIGMLESTTTATPTVKAATVCHCPPDCSGPGPRDIVHTPYLEKVIASIFSINQADSKLMVLDGSTTAIPGDSTGLIPASAYLLFGNDPALIGPEGIAVSPLFDRDSDRISDLVEARNIGPNRVNFRPTVADQDPSRANETRNNNGSITGGILLPEEGMGYYHHYGLDQVGGNRDNWGTLKLIRLLEQLGREWQQRHPNGPRLGIGDLSLSGGGIFFPHDWHQNGLDADIRYVRDDGLEAVYQFSITGGPDPAGYSLILTQELVDIICATGEVYEIFVDPHANLVFPAGCNITVDHSRGHFHHFHLAIKPD